MPLKIKNKNEGQCEGLPKSLSDKLNSLLDEANIRSPEREKIQKLFMAAANNAANPPLEPPKEAPELWKSGQGETSLEFLERVYKPYLEAGVLTAKWLTDHDPKLANAVSSAASQKSIDKKMLPITERDLLDREHKNLVESYGQDTMDRIYRTMNTLMIRKVRDKKKNSAQAEFSKK